MSVASRLREYLAEQFELATVVAGRGPEVAIAAGARMQRSRRVGYGVGLIAAIAVVGVAGFAFRTQSAPTEETLEEPSADNTATVAATDVATVEASAMASAGVVGTTEVDWEKADTTLSSLYWGWSERVVVTEGTFYALSTMPGRAAVPVQAIYASDDGLSWSVNAVGDDLWLSDLDGYEGSLYAIGTAPGTNWDWNTPVEARASVTSDGGATWQSTDLPVTATPPVDLGEIQWRSVGTEIAAGPQGVVAAVHTRYFVDYSELMPAEFRGGGPFEAMRTDTGIEIMDWQRFDAMSMACDRAWSTVPEGEMPAECVALNDMPPEETVVFRATWEELGIDEPTDRYSEVFMSSNGVDFESVPSPFRGTDLVDLLATDDGFVGVESSDDIAGSLRFWQSPDGREWEQVAAPEGLVSLVDMGTIGDELVVLGYGGGWETAGMMMFVLEGTGEAWRSQDLQSVLGFGDGAETGEFGVWISGQSIGPDGVAVAVMTESFNGPGAVRLYVSKDLSAWSELSMESIGLDFGAYLDSITLNGDIALVMGNVSGERFQQWFTVAGTVS